MDKIQKMISEQEPAEAQQLSDENYTLLHYYIMNQSATLIQKNWRGVAARKRLLQDLEHFARQEEKEEDDLVVVKKPASPQSEHYFYNAFSQ